MRIVDCEQGTEQWFAVRRGIPTASAFKKIITPKRADLSETAGAYICELVDDVMRPGLRESFGGNHHTERGHELEPMAREFYQFERDTRVKQVGFVLTDCGRFGCSPDALAGDGGAEIKAPDGPTHVRWLLKGGLPDEHKAQVHGNMYVTGAGWWDFLSYCPGYEHILIRVTRDDYTDKLGKALEQFHNDYTAALKRFGLRHPSENDSCPVA